MSETLVVVDRWDGGISWTLAGDRMQRTSHALVVDREGEPVGTEAADDEGEERDVENEEIGDADVWLVDPVDAPGLDDELAGLGDVKGVVLLLDRHKRDGAALARRHGVAVHLPAPLSPVADELDCEVEVFAGAVPDTGYRTITLTNNRFWREVALFDADAGTLVVPEAVGTGDAFTADDERIGVHAALRLFPPTGKLDDLGPQRILVGHGPGVFDDADVALRDALRGSRQNAPRLYLEMLSMPFK